MSTTTTNFGWTVPSDTDLVKDGAAAIRTALGGVDTSFVDLKGGTTGQVLSKASGTDLDFTWVAQDDSNAIQNAIVDAKGDLIAATAADTPARLAVGTNGQVLTADSAEATGMKWATSSSGGMTLLSTTTLSGSSTTISSISQSYNRLYVEITNINPSSDNVYVYIKANNTSNLFQGAGIYNYGGTVGVEGAGTNEDLPIGYFEQSNTDNSFALQLENYASTAAYKPAIYYGAYLHGTGTYTTAIRGGGFKTNTAISSLVFTITPGTFSGGTVKVWGIK